MEAARRLRQPVRLAAAALTLAASLSACGGERPTAGQVGFVEGFFGAVSADEPRAAEAGRDALTSGGNAADAAIAMYFTLTATLPSAASLGAGGACLVHDRRSARTEALLFPAAAAPGRLGASMPLAARAMALLHVRYGSLQWENLLSSGERIARFGSPVSRILARDLQAGATLIGADPDARRIYDRGGGVAISEGDVWTQIDLAGTLGAVKARGGGDMHQGALARQFADASDQIGAGITLGGLREAVPQMVATVQVPWGNQTAHFVPEPFAGGSEARAGWERRGSTQPGPGAPASDPANATAGFVAVDRDGSAVACTVGMGQLFGARRILPSTGVMLGAPSGSTAAYGPMIVANNRNGEFFFAGTSARSSDASQAVGAVAFLMLQGGQTLANAFAARPGGGTLNVVSCPTGLRADRARCQVVTDPRGSGLALAASGR